MSLATIADRRKHNEDRNRGAAKTPRVGRRRLCLPATNAMTPSSGSRLRLVTQRSDPKECYEQSDRDKSWSGESGYRRQPSPVVKSEESERRTRMLKYRAILDLQMRLKQEMETLERQSRAREDGLARQRTFELDRLAQREKAGAEKIIQLTRRCNEKLMQSPKRLTTKPGQIMGVERDDGAEPFYMQDGSQNMRRFYAATSPLFNPLYRDRTASPRDSTTCTSSI